MLPESTRIYSADDHIIEPPNLWLDRLPERFRDDAPRIVKENGCDVWLFEGERVPTASGSCRLLDGVEDRHFIAFDEIRPGNYDPHERIKDMDEDGVWGQLLFPNYARFAGHRFQGTKDPELGLA